ncbi:MAG: hypothetical protein OES38_11305, partial [Gammaproteobacteria bacterium]|nr:hypothetical protein [Gammaproteobacteria bacterium]
MTAANDQQDSLLLDVDGERLAFGQLSPGELGRLSFASLGLGRILPTGCTAQHERSRFNPQRPL